MTTMATTADEEMAIVQWLHLPWASNRKIYVPEEVNEELRRKITIERFWALVHQNPGLVRLSFPNLGAMNDLSKDYIFQSLTSLKHLRDLDLSLTLLNPRTILTSLPNLHRLQIYNLDGLLTTPLQEQFPGLHSLGLRTYVPISQVLKVLDHLPYLENLWIKVSVQDW
ncbi:hypothetical protein BGX24_010848 [Mortierella sp. AD032]|nr:hypothetical protein BGX24_010848 [Mortierella sp. AD032]